MNPMQLLTKLMKKQSSLVIFIVTLILYLGSLQIGYGPIMGITGIGLLLYFPGMFLMELFPLLSFGSGFFGKSSLSVVYSFCLSSILGFLAQSLWGFNSNYQVGIIVLLNIVVFLAYLLSLIVKDRPEEKREHSYQVRYLDYLPLVILASAIIFTLFLNPLAQNLDNYLNVLKQSIILDHNILANRQIFVSFIGLATKFLNLDILFVFGNIFVVLFFVSTLYLYDYLKRNIKSQQIVALIYLSLLIPPTILIEINRIMAQVGLLVLTIPVLFLCVESIKKNNISASIVALAISIVSLLYHELSAVLFLVSLTVFLVNLSRLLFVTKKVSWKYIIPFLIVLYPCINALNAGNLFTRILFRIHQALSGLNGLHWQWWFINNYKTVEGVQLGWTGIGVALYYLYGGILLLLILALLIGFMTYKKIKYERYWIGPATYLCFYFAAAEILPRFGIFFLPNRAWIHMMLAAVILLALLWETLEKNMLKIKYLPLLMLVIILIGCGGTFYLAKNNIYQVYREELPIADFIKNNTPKDALILSTQDNMALVNLYAERVYSQINLDHAIDRDNFDSLVNNTLGGLSTDKIIHNQPELVQASAKYQFTDNPSYLLQKSFNTGNNCVYFLYSYRKTGGLNDKREYRQSVIDSVNKNVYKQLGYPVVYSDDNAIVIKIR